MYIIDVSIMNLNKIYEIDSYIYESTIIVTYYYCHKGGKQRIWTEKKKVNSTRRERKF